MESQLHRRDYLHPVGEHKDEAQTLNDSAVVRSGLVEPTVMGAPVLAEDLYATHSDILDTPVRSFAQWEDEEKRGAPPPLSPVYETHLTDMPHGGHHTYGGEVNREQLKGSIGKHTFYEEEKEEERPRPPSTGVFGAHMTHFVPVGDRGDEDFDRDERMGTGKPTRMEEEMSVPNPATAGSLRSTDTGEKDVGINEVLHSLNIMKVFDEHEHDTKPLESDKHEPHKPHEPKAYTGSHDQFAPEPVENPPLDTIAANPSNPNSSYTQRISSATSAIADKASAVKDSIVSKLSLSGEDRSDASTTSPKTNTKSSFPTVFSHKVADTLSSTLGPVYEKVAAAGTTASSKMQRHGHDDTTGSPKTVKEYLVDTFTPGDDDKILSEAITRVFQMGNGKQPQEGTTTTTYEVEVMRDEGERRLQESGN
ncbi:hypothetical protein HanXRQr2_Chr13g0575891 [Helianthus annuus]|uniref:LTI65/LTI78 PGEED repeat domain-containing protein n=1 Tax=Helianthus annuus TaxID=4232 RepID=A0A251UKH2_HELAN|nr:low-temperature-induced 65 kDa protein [Helianthus annuus]KAF5772353.1 hypothetical protein HanXRQr2_Chr13g0575891 [Helianthus annuus]KAJ0475979.1 hypothetical protein HanHA300_Chr13g0471881 [Helianthus annuus]KAJ0496784.1 hypothetical protein HanHA89_Chr13g0503781 [Helianthus annuus]